MPELRRTLLLAGERLALESSMFEIKNQRPNFDDSKLQTLDSETVVSWSEVNRIHATRNGVYQRGGRLISLLTDFGRINPCYPDTHDENSDTILYTGAGRHGDQHLSPANRALLAAIESAHAVPLFCKLGVGRWQFVGMYRVTHGAHIFDATEQRMLWRFTLKAVTSDE